MHAKNLHARNKIEVESQSVTPEGKNKSSHKYVRSRGWGVGRDDRMGIPRQCAHNIHNLIINPYVTNITKRPTQANV